MNNFFNNLGWRMIRFMQGRNGMDTLAMASLGAGIVLTLLDFLLGSALLSLLGFAALVYAMFRCYSRDIAARALENARFEHATKKPRAAWDRFNRRWDARKTTKFFKCPQCGQELSVPKGKGTLRATCPKCHAQTTVKS
ncbi:MAG: zinc ribbon domain-containing protein [Eggerthellaceae bacterium]|nr:zinc ribbon domain-containing protein [Eggerthellaceae bacterium]